jgi:predicted  nucleic acid-binding Zn-ribbon protein
MVGSDTSEEPVVLDFESIRVLKPGKYELDLVNLFKNEPVIYKLDEGKYMIDLPQTFKSMMPKKIKHKKKKTKK